MAVADIARAYLQATRKWCGCDWPTRFGQTALNLEGLKAAQALLLARATAGTEAADWRSAVTWLTQTEQDARQAEEEAHTALVLAEAGRLREALEHARQAVAVEAQYHARPVWQALQEAVEATLADGTAEVEVTAGHQPG
jgi:hypothetical protein